MGGPITAQEAQRSRLLSGGSPWLLQQVRVYERPRSRSSIVDDRLYYDIRNHLVHFLTTRSKEFSELSSEQAKDLPKKIRLSQEQPSKPKLLAS